MNERKEESRNQDCDKERVLIHALKNLGVEVYMSGAHITNLRLSRALEEALDTVKRCEENDGRKED